MTSSHTLEPNISVLFYPRGEILATKNCLWRFVTTPIYSKKIYLNFLGFQYCTCIHIRLTIITKHEFVDHMKALYIFYRNLCNRYCSKCRKIFFICTETKYIGFRVIKDGVRTLSTKLYDIKSIDSPTNVHNLCWFIGIIHYYRDMWHKRAHKISPLNKLC